MTSHRHLVIVIALLAPAVAHAHGDGAAIAVLLAIDALLLTSAIPVIVFATKCAAWMQLILVAVYIATLAALFVLPLDIVILSGQWLWLGLLLHLAIPGLVTAGLFFSYRAIRGRLPHEAT